MSDAASILYGDGGSRPEPPDTTSDAASILYGNGAQAAQQPQQEPQQTTPESVLYPETEARHGNPYALEHDSADTLYGATDQVSLPEYLDTTGLLDSGGTPEVLRENLGYIAAEAGASADDVTNMASIAQEFVRSGQRVESEQQRAEILNEVMTQNSYTDRHLQDARDLVNSYPDLADWLARTGAGDDPRLVSHMMRVAQSPRAQKRIQQLRSKRA